MSNKSRIGQYKSKLRNTASKRLFVFGIGFIGEKKEQNRTPMFQCLLLRPNEEDWGEETNCVMKEE